VPYEIKKRANGKAEVVNKDTGKGHGVTTPAKAKKQMRLLYSVENNPKGKKSYDKKVKEMS
jgi:hypothetical protein